MSGHGAWPMPTLRHRSWHAGLLVCCLPASVAPFRLELERAFGTGDALVSRNVRDVVVHSREHLDRDGRLVNRQQVMGRHPAAAYFYESSPFPMVGLPAHTGPSWTLSGLLHELGHVVDRLVRPLSSRRRRDNARSLELRSGGLGSASVFSSAPRRRTGQLLRLAWAEFRTERRAWNEAELLLARLPAGMLPASDFRAVRDECLGSYLGRSPKLSVDS